MSQCHFVQGPKGQTMYARRLAEMSCGPLRAPHHTCSRLALGHELALAAGGVLYLDDLSEWRRAQLQDITRTWVEMDGASRPHLVLGFRVPRDPDAVHPIWKRSAWVDAWEALNALAPALPPVDHHVHVD